MFVEGEESAGKTALLHHCLSELSDFAVLHACCDAFEADIPFGIVKQLLRGAVLPSDADRFTDVRLGPDTAPSEAGTQLLRLLDTLQRLRALVIVVDDLQWVDARSAQALAFVLRRLRAEAVLTVLASRPVDRLPEPARSALANLRHAVLDRPQSRRLVLPGLSVGDVTLLAERSGAGHLEPRAAERIRRHTGGNPGHLRALLSETPREVLRAVHRPLPVPDPVAARVRRGLDELPESSRDLLGALAVLGRRCPLGLAARVGRVVDAPRALEPLLVSGLVRWWPEEPLTPIAVPVALHREAIYRSLSPSRRHELHAAAAEAVDGADAWAHRVAATSGTDDVLADALARASAEHAAAGTSARAGTLMRWAADLTSRRPEREHRLLTAAVRLVRADCSREAEELLPRLAACEPSPLRSLALGLVAQGAGRLAEAEPLLLDAAGAPHDLGPEGPPAGLPGELGEVGEAPGADMTSGGAAVFVPVPLPDAAAGTAGEPHDGSIALYANIALATAYLLRDRSVAASVLARRAYEAAGADESARRRAGLLLVEALGGLDPSAATALRRLEGLPACAEVRRADLPLLWPRARWRLLDGCLTGAVDDLRVLLGAAEPDLLGPERPVASAFLGYGQYLLGSWEAAGATLTDAAAAAREHAASWRMAPVHSLAAVVHAGLGDRQQAAADLREAERCRRFGELAAHRDYPPFAAAACAQARGDYAGMLELLERMGGPAHAAQPWHSCQVWWRPLHVEALIGTRRLGAAAVALRELAALATDARSLRVAVSWLTGWLTQLGDRPGTAIQYYEEALTWPVTADDLPFHRARLEQQYGLLLLGRRNRRAAVGWLRRAHDRYAAMGALPFLDRCAADLRSCGIDASETVERPVSGGVLARLSDHERKVARLVGSGLTNKETAHELFLSPKTVEYHLSNIFAKLGIASRRELRELSRRQDDESCDESPDERQAPAAASRAARGSTPPASGLSRGRTVPGR